MVQLGYLPLTLLCGGSIHPRRYSWGISPLPYCVADLSIQEGTAGVSPPYLTVWRIYPSKKVQLGYLPLTLLCGGSIHPRRYSWGISPLPYCVADLSIQEGTAGVSPPYLTVWRIYPSKKVQLGYLPLTLLHDDSVHAGGYSWGISPLPYYKTDQSTRNGTAGVSPPYLTVWRIYPSKKVQLGYLPLTLLCGGSIHPRRYSWGISPLPYCVADLSIQEGTARVSPPYLTVWRIYPSKKVQLGYLPLTLLCGGSIHPRRYSWGISPLPYCVADLSIQEGTAGVSPPYLTTWRLCPCGRVQLGYLPLTWLHDKRPQPLHAGHRVQVGSWATGVTHTARAPGPLPGCINKKKY